LEGLREELDRATKDDLTSQLLGLLHRFETHEADENQLLLSAWCDDLGVGD
jgi:hypothetical protein